MLVATVVAAGALGLGGDRGGDPGDDAAQNRGSQVVEVERGTLTQQTEIDGHLGHGPEVPFPLKAAGTVTWLPELGRTVRRGETVLRVDDRPVVLLYGSMPAYRELGTTQAETPAAGGGVDTGDHADRESDGDAARSGAATTEPSPAPAPLRGPDVKQFETNLRALGYTGFSVDESYTTLTADAVKRWQEDLDLPATGRVGIGDIVYAPGPVRIGNASGQVGAQAAGVSVSHTGTARMVTVNSPATDLSWAGRGRAVMVDLPDGRSVRGTVASVGKDASAAQGPDAGGEGGSDSSESKESTVAVVITFDRQSSLGTLESGPVTVHYLHKQRAGVLTVPVAALVALAEGGYGLELADAPTGTGHFSPVTTGLFADGRVEVSGPGVRQGLKVRIPE